MGKLLILSLLILLVVGDKILVILDNKQLEDTHSQFFGLLKGDGRHSVEIAHSFGRNNIELKYYDRFRYEHIIVMSTSDKGNSHPMQIRTARSRLEISSLTLMREEMWSSLEMSILPSLTENSSMPLESSWMILALSSRTISIIMNLPPSSQLSTMKNCHHSSLRMKERALYSIRVSE